MLLYTPEGPRSVDERDVIAVYRQRDDSLVWATATLCMANGEEITGRCLVTALDALEAKLDDFSPPPIAA